MQMHTLASAPVLCCLWRVLRTAPVSNNRITIMQLYWYLLHAVVETSMFQYHDHHQMTIDDVDVNIVRCTVRRARCGSW